ncbi:MAG: phosphotransferase-like protein [Acidimicrobiales bacterium]
MGRVVIVNGGSSAGTTTLVRGVQTVLGGDWSAVSVDTLLWTLPSCLYDRSQDEAPDRSRTAGQPRRSMMVTLAWPPPSHMVCRP